MNGDGDADTTGGIREWGRTSSGIPAFTPGWNLAHRMHCPMTVPGQHRPGIGSHDTFKVGPSAFEGVRSPCP